VSHVLVEHHAVQYGAVLEEAAGYLLDLGVALNVDLDVVAFLAVDGLDGLDSQVDDEGAPLGGELGADA
jgi:hypothetical protein